LNQIGGTHEFRNFLQNRGGEILKLERESLTKNNTCSINGKCVALSGKPKNVLPCGTCYTNFN
jgi:hypothetical protein